MNIDCVQEIHRLLHGCLVHAALHDNVTTISYTHYSPTVCLPRLVILH